MGGGLGLIGSARCKALIAKLRLGSRACAQYIYRYCCASLIHEKFSTFSIHSVLGFLLRTFRKAGYCGLSKGSWT